LKLLVVKVTKKTDKFAPADISDIESLSSVKALSQVTITIKIYINTFEKRKRKQCSCFIEVKTRTEI
jgi:hypothetical protein